jgi:putative NIF3 family GTP cyclohydrolase 1 type 2
MAKTPLSAIVRYADHLLRTTEFQDWDGAANGLQVENNGTVTRIAAAVDASLATVKLAIAAKADLMIVHHGLFWGATHPWTGKRYELLRQLMQNNLAVYSSHLPLDAHPQLGNNAQLCRSLGFKNLQPFFFEKEQFIGFQTRNKIQRQKLADRLSRVLGSEPILLPGGPAVCRRIGVVTGGAGGELKTAAADFHELSVTWTRVGPSRRPRPWTHVTLFFVIRLLSPVHIRLTIASRRLAIVASWWILAITISEMLLNPIVYYYLKAPEPELVLLRERAALIVVVEIRGDRIHATGCSGGGSTTGASAGIDAKRCFAVFLAYCIF